MTTAHPPLMTTAEAAAELGISRRRVQALVKDRNLGQHLGRDILLTPADVDAMRVRLPGRPRRIAPTAPADAAHESQTISRSQTPHAANLARQEQE